MDVQRAARQLLLLGRDALVARKRLGAVEQGRAGSPEPVLVALHARARSGREVLPALAPGLHLLLRGDRPREGRRARRPRRLGAPVLELQLLRRRHAGYTVA